MKALFASAALAAVLVTPAFADFYIVQEPTSKRCIIVEERPAIGVLGSFTTLHRAAVGDARGTTRTLNREAIYDYQYAAASRDYGAVVWMDARDATDCPAVDAYRQSLIDRSPIAAPSPLTDCPPGFGNGDIYSGSFPDPTP